MEDIISSGIVYGLTIPKSVPLTILDGGTMVGTNIKPGGSASVSSGGTMDTVFASDCTVTVVSGGKVSGLFLKGFGVGSYPRVTVADGGSVNNAILNTAMIKDSAYNMYAFPCYMFIESGGVVENVIVNGQGNINVRSGGTAANVVLGANDFDPPAVMTVDRDATVNGVTVNSGGSLLVYSGGTVTGIVENGGIVSVDSKDTTVTFASNTFSGYVGSCTVHSGTTANSAILRRTRITVFSGGSAVGTVDSGGVIEVSSGGFADSTTLKPYVDNNTRIQNASMFVSSGGVADHTRIAGLEFQKYYLGGSMTLSGGTANYTTVRSGGYFIMSGGTANNTTIDGYVGFCTVFPSLSEGDETFSGTFKIANGVADSTTVNPGGRLVIGGGEVTNVVENGGYVEGPIKKNSIVPNAFSRLVLGKFESATVHSGTTAVSVTLVNGGSLELYNGGKLTGRTLISSGTISAYEGAILDFDLTQTAPGAAARIDALSSINDCNSAVYTLTVNADQTEGVYALAGDVSEFQTTISVVNTSGDELGTLSLDETSYISGVGYTLLLSQKTLSLKIGETDTPSPYTSDGLVLNNETGEVLKGETFHDTQIFSSGRLDVSQDGTADATTVFNTGSLCIKSGGTATNIVENGGFVNVKSGAEVSFASNVFRNSALTGSVTLHSGTTACNVKMIGSMYVYDGGVVSGVEHVMPTRDDNIGFGIEVESGGIANDVELVNYYCRLSLYGGTANRTILNYSGVNMNGTIRNGGGGAMTVELGGTANSTTVGWGGLMQIYEGTANDTTILRGGSVFVSRNKAGITSRVLSNTVVDGGHLSVGSGCEVDGVKVNLGGTFVFSEGGVKAVNIIENGGYVSVTYGKDTTVSFLSNTFHDAELSFRTQTAATVHSGTTAVNTTVNSGGTLWIYAGGVADGIMINSRGAAKLDGGTAANVVISSMGRMLASGYRRGNDSDSLLEAVLDNVVVNSGGSLSISDAKEVNGLMVLSGGLLSIENTKETSFSGTVLCGPAATIALERGATATDTVLNEMGRLSVNYGAVAVSTTVNANGNLNVSSGGTATDIVASGGAYLGFEVAPDTFIAGTSKGSSFEIRDGGVSDYTVNCGYLNVSFGGSANNTTVNENGEFYVSDGGVADGITVNENGTMVVSGGGKLTGQMAFENGASVSMLEGAILDFDLSRTEADAEALVNGLSVIQGKTLYTLTVADDWEPGYYTYTLAEGADGFNGTISVVNRAGETLGTFTVGETITAGYNDYSLFLANSTLSVTVMAPDLTPATPVGTPDKVSWDATGANMYILEYSTDNFEHLIQLSTTAAAMDILELPAGTYQWRVKADANSEWMVGDEIVSEADPEIPKVVQAVEDGNDDLFFATPFGTWGDFSCALHTGSINDWNGTREIVLAKGRGRIQNLFFGSADPNVLCLTDADNGDAIFVDDIYTDSPEDMAKETSRLYKIQEIRAGAGDDIVDMTSQRFEYTGNGLTIRGGDGNDVLWANKGENLLFGDAGNDRIVGASSSDVIAGGIGDDTMHGGGGDDVFTFCDNWGADTVDQLETGTVTLWFASGSETNWNAESLTYTDGDNSVKVSGVTLEKITLIFGDDGSAQFAALSGMGAFDAFSSRKIFEESSAGILA